MEGKDDKGAEEMSCKDCARKDTEFCMICENEEFKVNQDQLAWQNFLCDMMCPESEEED